jgi:hypothetical protein
MMQINLATLVADSMDANPDGIDTDDIDATDIAKGINTNMAN